MPFRYVSNLPTTFLGRLADEEKEEAHPSIPIRGVDVKAVATVAVRHYSTGKPKHYKLP